MEEKEYEKYSKDYSEGDFWKKLGKYAKSIGLTPLTYALALFYLLKSDDVSGIEKIKIIGALGYLISPIDVVPDFIPVAGYADDGGVLYLVYKAVKNNITDEIIYDVYLKLNDWFSVKLEEIAEILYDKDEAIERIVKKYSAKY